MSKENFSKKISGIMNDKMLYLDNLAYDIFFKKDDYFELVLCLSYMTLSKEKIIKKDMNNNDRLSRLTRMVSEEDINKVFDPKYFSSLPNIIYSKETDKTWILDNIRDSIMHGTFDIDEENQCFVINNQQFDRELIAKIPFSWFVEYSKYDILSKKLADKYTIKGFYYNVDKNNKKYLNTKKEIINNILFNVKISGNNFNLEEIEKRVKELFAEYSKEEIKESDIEKYQERIDKEKIKYNKKYLTSFYLASEKIEQTIKKEFPDINIQIYIDNRKNRLANKLTKRLSKYYKNYKIMYNELNNSISNKSNSLLKRITTIIENLNNIPTNYSDLNYYQIMDMFNTIVQGEKIEYTDKYDIYTCFNSNIKSLREICLHAYGLSTLVINQENLYNQYFLNKNPSEYGVTACTKQKYLDYANEEKKLIIKIIEKEIRLYDKNNQLSNCSQETAKKLLIKDIQKITTDYKTLKQELADLKVKHNYRPYINYGKKENKKMEYIQKALEQYYSHLHKANSVKDKIKIKKIISKLLNQKIEEESKYTYGYCTDMKETLTVIRNCFSHIGRINIKNDLHKHCILTDYDNNHEQSGIVFGEYLDLINLLSSPLTDEITKSKHK